MIPLCAQRLACIILNIRRRRSLKRDWEPVLRRSPQDVEHLQTDLLKRLLIHAGTHVPYYRKVFREIGFIPHEMTALTQLSAIPVLTKEIIRREGKRMVAENAPSGELMEKSTGGSTGDPLVFYRDRSYLQDAQMGTFRNLAQCGWRPGDPVANFWGINDPSSFGRRAMKEQLNLGFYTFDAFNAGNARFIEWLDRLQRIRPVAFYGYGSTIWLFCKWIEGNDVPHAAFSRLKGVFLTAEKLHDFQRACIERVLDVPVFNLYGSTEIQNVAFECLDGRLHIASDFVVVEEENPESDGKSELLLTSLRNYAMPFIRYRNGDEGKLSGAVCNCGIATPCMSLDVSRSCDNFVTRSGRIIHGEFFTHVMEGIRGVRTFQFRQTSLDAVRLLVVPDETADAETKRQVNSVPSSVRNKTKEELSLEIEWVNEIPPTPRGKHLFTISEIGDHTQTG